MYEEFKNEEFALSLVTSQYISVLKRTQICFDVFYANFLYMQSVYLIDNIL